MNYAEIVICRKNGNKEMQDGSSALFSKLKITNNSAADRRICGKLYMYITWHRVSLSTLA